MITIASIDYPVVDAHVHVFPPHLVVDRSGWVQLDQWFGELYGSPAAKLLGVDDLIASMDAAGVDFSLLCGFPWRDADNCRMHNDYMATCVAAHPDRLAWLGICPIDETAADIARACFAAGASGLGEFNADAQGLDFHHLDAFASIADVCREHDRPIMIHASEPVGHRYPGKGEATPGRILTLAERFPDLSIVAAHWGGGLPFYELMPKVRPTLVKVAYDSAATTYLYDHRIFNDVISIAGGEKVIFASDFPVLGQKRLVDRMATMTWQDQKTISAVLSGNARRIYRLPVGA